MPNDDGPGVGLPVRQADTRPGGKLYRLREAVRHDRIPYVRACVGDDRPDGKSGTRARWGRWRRRKGAVVVVAQEPRVVGAVMAGELLRGTAMGLRSATVVA